MAATKDKAEIFDIDNGAGWSISLKRVPARGVARKAGPALIVPGYGMNSFIFGFHPRGLSLEDFLASRGIETWSADLRGMGRAKNTGGNEDFGLADYVDDVKVAVDAVIERSEIENPKIDLIGCSLGATLVFSYLALHPDAPVNCAVNFGGLVTWKKIHPAVRIAFASTRVVEKVHLKHTRTIAGLALPLIIKHAPKLLAIYMNTESTDTSNAATMVQTVEDPVTHVNIDIAHWLKDRELTVRGVNVSRALGEMTYPHMTVLAKDDGIVPPETARALFEGIASTDKEILEVGGNDHPMAHADLFLATGAQDLIFKPLSEFLLKHAHSKK